MRSATDSGKDEYWSVTTRRRQHNSPRRIGPVGPRRPPSRRDLSARTSTVARCSLDILVRGQRQDAAAHAQQLGAADVATRPRVGQSTSGRRREAGRHTSSFRAYDTSRGRRAERISPRTLGVMGPRLLARRQRSPSRLDHPARVGMTCTTHRRTRSAETRSGRARHRREHRVAVLQALALSRTASGRASRWPRLR